MNKSLALNPNNAEVLTMLADCEVATAHYDEAIASARHVHAIPHQHFAVVHLIAATAFERQHKPRDAAAEYQQFLTEDPDSPRAATAREALQRLSAQGQGSGAVKP